MKIEQQVVTLNKTGAEYYNFLFTPGSQGSLKERITEGWRAVLIKENATYLTILFQKRAHSVALESLEGVIDTLVEVGNGVTDEDLHKAASELILFRDRYREFLAEIQ